MAPAPSGSTISYAPKREPEARGTGQIMFDLCRVLRRHDADLQAPQFHDCAVAIGFEDLQLCAMRQPPVHASERPAPLPWYERRYANCLERTTSKRRLDLGFKCGDCDERLFFVIAHTTGLAFAPIPCLCPCSSPLTFDL